jgi:ATP-dependent Clp protease ATP-binding subunit ClpA
MARLIQDHIKRPLAEDLLFGKLVGGGNVRVTVSEDGTELVLIARSAHEPELLTQSSE